MQAHGGMKFDYARKLAGARLWPVQPDTIEIQGFESPAAARICRTAPLSGV
jgi:hypothetical protein